VYAVSPEFKRAVRGSHRVVVRAEVWRGDVKVLDLEPLDGQVEIDGRRGIRRTCEVTVAAPGPTVRLDRQAGTYLQLEDAAPDYDGLALVAPSYALLAPVRDPIVATVDAGIVPDVPTSALAPYGNELRLFRGVRVGRDETSPVTYADIAADYADYDELSAVASYGVLATPVARTVAVDELVPLGVFLITDVQVTTGPDGTTVTVQGSDRALRISRNRWAGPYPIRNLPTEDAIDGLLVDRWLDVDTDLPATGRTVRRATLGVGEDNDPWADARGIAQAAGYDLYFDGNGVAVMDQVPDYADASPVEIYLEDDEAMVLELTRGLTSERSYNGVIATGEGSDLDDVYRGEAWDDDPASPTYRFGPYGQYPRFYSSPLLASDDEAEAAAASLLARIRGIIETVEWTQIVDPSLDAGDLVEVRNAATKLRRAMVLDRLTIPLSPSQPMTAVARAIRTTGGFDDGED
jgi:hypothetical protein